MSKTKIFYAIIWRDFKTNDVIKLDLSQEALQWLQIDLQNLSLRTSPNLIVGEKSTLNQFFTSPLIWKHFWDIKVFLACQFPVNPIFSLKIF